VKLNCAAIPNRPCGGERVIWSRKKGAFTGAVIQKIGRLELSDQGTLFFWMKWETSHLRFSQSCCEPWPGAGILNVWASNVITRKVNVRLVAATNRDLEKMVATKEFRNDSSITGLNVFPIRIPPLRDRKEGHSSACQATSSKSSAKEMQKPHRKRFLQLLMKGLTDWDWPGNIR